MPLAEGVNVKFLIGALVALGLTVALPGAQAQAQSSSCTRDKPCVGPRGGVYYYTQSGKKRYIPRR